MERGRKILIIEDDPEIADLVGIHVADLNWQLDKAATGTDGLQMAGDGEYDLVILDIMLPEMDGFDVCRQLRQMKQYVPILMLTARAEEFDRVLGLELGADDYITKPFSIRELLARMKAIFRRVEVASSNGDSGNGASVIEYGDLRLDLGKRKVTLCGDKINLTVKEYDLLALFAKNPGRSYSRSDLLGLVWGYQYAGYDHTVNSHINRLRSKIENDPANPRFIKTVWGHGYRFADLEELG
jgi:two-component system alkaline phosphatase synthesis response regulator PhoP